MPSNKRRREKNDVESPRAEENATTSEHPNADLSQMDRRDNENSLTNKRAKMADIARRRAALFATWDDGAAGRPIHRDSSSSGVPLQDEINGNSSVHAGGNEARRLGPWSSARELAQARENELQKRNETILKRSKEQCRDEKEVNGWIPARDVRLGPRRRDEVPRLSAVCVKMVAEMLDEVETLWGLPEHFKVRIGIEACRRRALTAKTFHLFTEDEPVEIQLPDCSALEAEDLTRNLTTAATSRLRKLSLGFCGRGMIDVTAMELVREGVLNELTHLHLGGAYKLTDQGVTALCTAAPKLQELSLPRCSRITGESIESLPLLLPELRYLDLTEVGGLSQESISTALKGLPFLCTLVLDGIPEVSESSLIALSNNLKNNPKATGLETLSLRRCHSVTLHGLLTLGKAHQQLRRLHLDDCNQFSGSELCQIAEQFRSLEHISLKRCDRAVDDSVVDTFVNSGAIRSLVLNGCSNVTSVSIESLISHCKNCLEELDVSWCRKIKSSSLGSLADSCRFLQKLVLWGCSQVDNDFLFGHSNEKVEIVGRGENLLPVV